MTDAVENEQALEVTEDIQGDEEGTEAITVAEIGDVLEARADFYETLAALYFYPLKQEQIDAMAEADLSPYADVNEDFAEGINDITRTLRKRNTGTRQELAVDFTGAFIGTSTWEGRSAVPYKSVFTSEGGLIYQGGYQEVFDAFKQEAVKKRAGLDWPDDHLSFMFQFLALLSRRAHQALLEGKNSNAVHDLTVSADFLHDHIASWFDAFFDLANKLVKTRFYRGVLKITRGYITFDAEVLQDLIEEVEGLDGR